MASLRLLALLGTALIVAVGGCGQSSEPADEPQAQRGFPVTVTDAGGTLTLKRRPERIVSISPTATETLFAVGAGDQVVAVDDQSDYPPGAPRTGLSSYEPNVEAIAGYRPDLVVVADGGPRDVADGLRRLGLTVLVEPVPAGLEQAYRQLRMLGAVSGHADAGERLARRVRGRVERLLASAPRGPARTVFHELDPDLFSASSQTFIGSIYARLGLRNVADRAARRAGSPYPQLSSEAVVAANPDLIVLADGECCDQTPAKVRRRAGWAGVSAVRSGAVVAIDDDVASRWGPRIPLFVERVVGALEDTRG